MAATALHSRHWPFCIPTLYCTQRASGFPCWATSFCTKRISSKAPLSPGFQPQNANSHYYDYFPVIGSPPSTGPLQSVSWSYSFSSMPSGMVVLLCQTGIGCINVTSSARGTTTAFNTAGGHPNGQFYLNYAVNGTGTMSPVYSNNNNVIVNW